MRGEEGLFRLSVRNPPLCRFSERIFPPNTFFSATFDSFFFCCVSSGIGGGPRRKESERGFVRKTRGGEVVGRGTSAGRLSLLKLDFGEQVGREGGRIPFLASGLAKKKRGQGRVRPRPLRSLYSAHTRSSLFESGGRGGEGEKVEKTDGDISLPPSPPPLATRPPIIRLRTSKEGEEMPPVCQTA